MPNKKVLTAQEAADFLGVSRQTLIKWIDAGELDAWTTKGGHYRLERETVERYRKERMVR